MPIAGGYDVQLGTNKYVLDEPKDSGGYDHYYRPIADGEQKIYSAEDALSSVPDILSWDITDWSGGEGARRWYSEDPTVYDYSTGLNGRIRGQITGRPLRGTVSVTVDDQRLRPYLAIGAGRLWIGSGLTLRYSSDQGATWTDASTPLALAAGWKITGMVGNHEGIYVAAKNSTNRILRKVAFPSGTATGYDVVASAASTNPWVGLSIMGGRLYAWTGRKLFEMDIASTLPLVNQTSYRKVYDTGVDLDYADFGGSAAGSWWADCQASENGVLMLVGVEGQTNIHEFDGKAGVEIWKMDFGFTGKSLKVQGGVVYVAGHWSGESSPTGGFGTAYAMPLDSLVPLHLGWFRKQDGSNFQMQEMANSYGKQIMIAAATVGKVFIYDADYDAIHLLDDLANGANDKIGDMITHGTKRIVAVYSPGAGSAGTAINIYRYSSDEPGDRETVGSLSNLFESGEFDFNRPHDPKVLEGFHVTFKPLLANQRITISYSLDGAAFVDTTVITSATTGSAFGRVFITVATGSNDPRFYRLEVKATLDNNTTNGVAQPILYAVCARAKVINFEEVWDLTLRIKNEHQKSGRGTSSARLAEQLRDNVWTLAQAKTIFTFLDGTRYASKPNLYSTHTVRIELVKDSIKRGGSERSAEGACFVRLVAIPT